MKKSGTASDGLDMEHRRLELGIVPWELTDAQTATLITRCKQEQVSVHAAICTAFLLAQGDGAPEPARRRRTVLSPVNIRQRLALPAPDAVGVYVGRVKTSVDCAPQSDFWEIARNLRKSMKQQTTDRRVFLQMLLTRRLLGDDFDIAMLQQIRAIRQPTDIAVSNLGELDLPVQYGSLHLQALYGPLVRVPPDGIVVGAATAGGKLHFCSSWMGPSVDAAMMQRIGDGAMRRLGEVAGWTALADDRQPEVSAIAVSR